MCQYCLDAAGTRKVLERKILGRRSFLKVAGAVAGLALAPQAFAANDKPPPKPENVVSPDAALDRLMKGNARYVDGVSRRHDFKHEREALSTGQNPFAAILSCADSRIAPEYCFDSARGDLFVCRVAGNFASDEVTPASNMPCGAQHAAHHGARPRGLRRGRRHHQIGQGRHHAARPFAVAGRGASSRRSTPCKGESGDMLTNAIRRNVIAQCRQAEERRADPEIVRRRQENPHRRRRLRTQDRARWNLLELTAVTRPASCRARASAPPPAARARPGRADAPAFARASDYRRC